MSSSAPLWCGIDCSTQSLKVLLLDSAHVIVHEVAVNFDQRLQQHFPGMKAGITRATYGLPKQLEQNVIDNVTAARTQPSTAQDCQQKTRQALLLRPMPSLSTDCWAHCCLCLRLCLFRAA